MKRITTLLAMLLVLAVAVSAVTFTSAENTQEESWQADLLKLMDPRDVPEETVIELGDGRALPADASTRTYAQELISSNGDTLNIRVKFLLDGIELSDAQWTEISEWLKGVVTGAVQSVQADSRSLANVTAEALRAQREAARPDETGALPIWANPGLVPWEVRAAVPYYPVLANGVNGAATQRLQEALIRLGYLDDKADGYFGGKTQAAVERLEQYVRALEQDLIDALPTPEPTATPEPTPTPGPDEAPVVIDEPLVAPEPTQEPGPTPATPVDGVADALLQAYLYSDSFQATRGALRAGDSGDAVARLQLRLARLGYMADAADGSYGGGTARSVRIFQYYNGLEQTGAADVETQRLLFSEGAKRPDNSLLTVGSSGDEVSRLQKRLRILGFAAIAVDGGFGKSTRAGVENLQQYMRELEAEAAGVNGAEAPAEALTVEVNGIADPMLLDDFYADSFPAIPAAMTTGSAGRDVVRLQRRLNCLEYYYSALDGDYGPGTAKAVMDFQKRNGLGQTGEADAETLRTLFNENALKALKPYVLKVSTSDQRVYAYGLDANNEYTVLVRTMKCSTGRNSTPTPTGTYKSSTGPGARWHYFEKFKCWAQYAYYIQGDIMFHSVLYGSKGGSVTRSSVNNLGRKASHGCVRLSVDDAKWIWNNCPRNTQVVVY